MGVPINSRYRRLRVHDAPGTDGVPRPTVPILRHERADPAAPRYRHRVSGAEDIEYLAWRLVGSGEDWWRIADANPVAFPLDVRPGDALSIPSNVDAGLLPTRERRF